MQRFTVRSLVFLCGLLVAIGLERAREVAAPRRSGGKSASLSGKNAPSKSSDTVIQTPAPSLSEILRQESRSMPDLTLVKPKATPMLWTEDELVQAVQSAARDGTSRSLGRLNGKSLSSLPEYRERILPILKKECLLVLLRRFSTSDWTDWPRASFVLEGSPTPARTYVNDVFIVNEDLGKFLETAALLFHVSYLSAAEGKIVQPEVALERIFAQADRFLVYRAPKAIPPRDMLDPEILDFPFVRDRMKQIESGLVMRYIKDHPEEYGLHFELLSQLPNDTIFPEVNSTLADLLQRFALEASPKFRQSILDRVLGGHLIADRSRQDGRVARALAHLFLMGVVDSMEANDLRRAHLYLDESYGFDPHLPAQDLVAEAIRRASEQTAAAAKADAAAKKQGTGPQAKPAVSEDRTAEAEKEEDSPFQLFTSQAGKEQKSESSFIERSVAFLFYLLVGILVFGGAFLYFLYRRGLKAAGAVEMAGDQKPPVNDIPVTASTEVPFGADRSAVSPGSRSHLRAAASGG